MDYTADLPSQSADDDLPTYMIYRDVRPGEPFDPSAPLHFLPPKDSDELFDALRLAYPHLKTHSERLRDATIKFLLEEQQAYTSSNAPHGPATTQPATQTFAVSSTPTASSSSSTLNVWNHATIETKGKFKHVPSSQSNNQSSTLLTKDMPPQEDMTGVFSISSVQPKQHSRRRMTEREKAEYRQRRMAKACDRCAKRKRKCIHHLAGGSSPQPEQEGSRRSSSKATSDISSSTTSIHSQDQRQREASQETDPMFQDHAKEGISFGYSGDQLMVGFQAFADFNIPDWYTGTNSAVLTAPLDPFLQTTLLHTASRESETGVPGWSQRDQLLDDWPTEFPSELMMPPNLRMNEFLQSDEIGPEHWQVPWSQASTSNRIACVVSPHSEEEYVLPEDNEWCISPRLLAGKSSAALQDALSFSTLRRRKIWNTKGNAAPDDLNGHNSSPSSREQPQQTPEVDPKIPANHNSHCCESADQEKMTLRENIWRREAFRWVSEAMLKNASTIGTLLTLMIFLLRPGENIIVLHGDPTLKLPSDVSENDGRTTSLFINRKAT